MAGLSPGHPVEQIVLLAETGKVGNDLLFSGRVAREIVVWAGYAGLRLLRSNCVEPFLAERHCSRQIVIAEHDIHIRVVAQDWRIGVGKDAVMQQSRVGGATAENAVTTNVGRIRLATAQGGAIEVTVVRGIADFAPRA